jgi:hypothetical protein
MNAVSVAHHGFELQPVLNYSLVLFLCYSCGSLLLGYIAVTGAAALCWAVAFCGIQPVAVPQTRATGCLWYTALAVLGGS